PYNPPLPHCPGEQFPHAGAAANAASTPYEIPFSSQFNGGHLLIAAGAATVELGPPTAQYPTGQIFGPSCGVLVLPSLNGTIAGNPYGIADTPQYNNNIQFQGPGGSPIIPVAFGIPGLPGVSLLDGYGSAQGEQITTIAPTAAANGGLTIDFYGSAKSTAVIDPTQLASLLPTGTALQQLLLKNPLLGPVVSDINGLVANATSGECTIAIGSVAADGLGADPRSPLDATDKTLLARFSTPTHLTTGTAGSLTGQPATGPPTDTQLTLVSRFPVPPISPDMPPAPGAPGAGTKAPSQLCSQTSANLFNQLLGLPGADGTGTFVAPAKFSLDIPPNG
ncbi:MAG: hypothetical protein ACYC1D_01630, partial [Acidimicrobiales bacterium]